MRSHHLVEKSTLLRILKKFLYLLHLKAHISSSANGYVIFGTAIGPKGQFQTPFPFKYFTKFLITSKTKYRQSAFPGKSR